MKFRHASRFALLAVAALIAAPAFAQQGKLAEQVQASIDKGIEFIKSQQKPDGGWQTEKDPPAITALVVKALAQDPKVGPNAEVTRKGYDKLLSYQLENGGIYQDLLANYNTAIAISSLSAANNPAYKERIDRAVAYLKGLQWTDKTGPGPKGEKVADDKNVWWGGWGYGRSGRPDGSNTQIAVEALQNAGLAKDDPAFQNALKFITRMQNSSETNDQPWVGNDGGLVYTPANNGESFAGEYTSPDGKRMLRSYGSMTYAGLKSMIYAGLTRDDPRVKAAWDWIRKTYTVDVNPGMPNADPKNGDISKWGIYYYYHTMARALNVFDEPVIDTGKEKRDWRADLAGKLIGMQKPNGSWVGDKKWFEDNASLVTAYTILTLQEIQQDLKQHPAK